MSKDLSLFDYIVVNEGAPRTLFLFHGTGGSKEDFLFLEQYIPAYTLVGLQGNVREGDMTRFFARHAVGSFDQDSIREETNVLHRFVSAWKDAYKVRSEQMWFLGYSNGANMILATALRYSQEIRHMVLMHPMMPFDVPDCDLSGCEAFVSAGVHDPMVSLEESHAVRDALVSCGADAVLKEYGGGHEVAEDEIRDIVGYLRR